MTIRWFNFLWTIRAGKISSVSMYVRIHLWFMLTWKSKPGCLLCIVHFISTLSNFFHRSCTIYLSLFVLSMVNSNRLATFNDCPTYHACSLERLFVIVKQDKTFFRERFAVCQESLPHYNLFIFLREQMEWRQNGRRSLWIGQIIQL